MKRKTASIINLIVQGCFLLSCLIPFMELRRGVSLYWNNYYSDSFSSETSYYNCNLFSSLSNGLSVAAFILLILCFIAILLILVTDVTNTGFPFLINEKVSVWKNRLRFILPCAEIAFFIACMFGWGLNDYSDDYFDYVYYPIALASIPVFLLFLALCITELSYRNAQPGKPTEKKAIAGLILRAIGLLGILAGAIIHVSEDFDIGGFFYIGGAFFYLVGRFLSGIPAEEAPAAPAVDNGAALTQTGSDAIEAPASQNAPQAAEAAKDNGVDEIRKYKALLDDGIITQEEFDEKKKQILGL